MKNFKVLILLIVLVLFVNYINYFLPNRDKIDKKIVLLENKIGQQEALLHKKIDQKDLNVSYEKYFFDGKVSGFSQSMGTLQKKITKSAQGNCKVKKIKWLQIPQSQEWYDKLKMNVTLECLPKDVFLFINNLRSDPKLFTIRNFKALKMKKGKRIYVNFQLIAYRKKK